MSILADVRNSVDDVESVGPNSQSRQTRRDSLNNGRATVDRPASAEKSKPRSFDSAALGETIRLAQLGDPSTAGRFDRQTAPRALYRAVPAGYRTIFVLHDIQGYRHEEIAEIVGRSVGDSKSQLHKARMRLRELLHEAQREKARNDRQASRKLRARLRTSLPPLTALLALDTERG